MRWDFASVLSNTDALLAGAAGPLDGDFQTNVLRIAPGLSQQHMLWLVFHRISVALRASSG